MSAPEREDRLRALQSAFSCDRCSGLEDLDKYQRFLVQTRLSDLVERIGLGKQQNDEFPDIARLLHGLAHGSHSTLVNRRHAGQIERDGSSWPDGGHRVEELSGILTRQRSKQS